MQAAIAGLMALSSALNGHVPQETKEPVMVHDPWARPTLSAETPSAAYLIVHNTTEMEDRLIAAKVPQTIAQHTELHQTVTEGGISKMRYLPDGMVVPANGKLRLEPGGRHIMLFDLIKRLDEGTEFPMTLVFEKAGSVDVVVFVKKPDGQADGTSSKHRHH